MNGQLHRVACAHHLDGAAMQAVLGPVALVPTGSRRVQPEADAQQAAGFHVGEYLRGEGGCGQKRQPSSAQNGWRRERSKPVRARSSGSPAGQSRQGDLHRLATSAMR